MGPASSTCYPMSSSTSRLIKDQLPIRLAVEALLLLPAVGLATQGILALAQIAIPLPEGTDGIVLLNVFADLLLAIALAVLILKRVPDLFSDTSPIGIGRLTTKQIATVLAVLISCLTFDWVTFQLSGAASEVGLVNQLLESASPLMLGLLIFFAVGPGVLVEEFLFRGVIYRVVSDHTRQVSAVLITTSLFTLVHLTAFGPDLHSLMSVFFLGLAAQVLVIKTRSLLAGILLHFLKNCVALAAFAAASFWAT